MSTYSLCFFLFSFFFCLSFFSGSVLMTHDWEEEVDPNLVGPRMKFLVFFSYIPFATRNSWESDCWCDSSTKCLPHSRWRCFFWFAILLIFFSLFFFWCFSAAQPRFRSSLWRHGPDAGNACESLEAYRNVAGGAISEMRKSKTGWNEETKNCSAILCVVNYAVVAFEAYSCKILSKLQISILLFVFEAYYGVARKKCPAKTEHRARFFPCSDILLMHNHSSPQQTTWRSNGQLWSARKADVLAHHQKQLLKLHLSKFEERHACDHRHNPGFTLDHMIPFCFRIQGLLGIPHDVLSIILMQLEIEG